MTNAHFNLFLNECVKEGCFPGANYAVVTPNNICIDSVGYKQLYPSVEQNNINILYDQASLTKVLVTNTIISRMIYKNKIQLSDKIADFLPQFKHKNVTLFDLLTHTSGLPADANKDLSQTKEELINSIFNMDLEYETGSKAVYSDVGFIILGILIEKVYGKPLDQVAKEEVFEPLNMVNSCFNPQNKDNCAATENDAVRGILKGVVHDEKGYVLGGVCGCAGLFSDIYDIVKFSNMVLHDGIVNNEVYLSKDIIDLWFKPLNNIDNASYRSIGWIVGDTYGATGGLGNENTIFHLGFTGTSIVIDRGRKIAAILLTNRVHPTRKNQKHIEARAKFYQEIIKELNKEQTLSSNFQL